MRNRINTFIIAATLAIILIAVEIVIIKTGSKFEPEVSVVYAACKIEMKTVITADMVAMKKVRLNQVHKKSYSRLEDVIGKVALAVVEDGEQVLSSRIGVDNEIPDIKVNDKNNRLCSVELRPDQANGWWLKTGQYVDILFVSNTLGNSVIYKPQGPNNVNNPQPGNTNTGLQLQENGFEIVDSYKESLEAKNQRINKVRIAALLDENGHMLDNVERVSMPRYVVFEVTNKQDEFIAFAKNNGKIELSVIP